MSDGIILLKPTSAPWERMANLLAATGANVIHENRPDPIYVPPKPWSAFPNHVEGDVILAPPLLACRGPDHYWSNIAHELMHWAEVRTGWLCQDMSMREFVAELGSAFILRHLGLCGDGDQFNARQWLPDWVEAMRRDPGWYFEAVERTTQTVTYLLSCGCEGGYVGSILIAESVERSVE